MPAGIITHATRGLSSLATKSASSVVPRAPSFLSSATESALVSNATPVWPSRMTRRKIFAPIRPRPIIPSCISVPLSPRASSGPARSDALTGSAVATDQRVGGTVVREFGLGRGGQLGRHLLRQHLAEFDAPLVEGVHAPHRSLHEHAVLVERDQRAERVRRELFDQARV